MAVRVARARAIGQNMTGHGSHDSAGQSSPKQIRVEQSKKEASQDLTPCPALRCAALYCFVARLALPCLYRVY